jgi:hypothetical protein
VDLIRRLRDILWLVRAVAGDAFSGVGVVICDEPDNLPIIPLRTVSGPLAESDLVTTLASISVLQSEFHDGFHIVSSKWRLSRVAQYFSPAVFFNSYTVTSVCWIEWQVAIGHFHSTLVNSPN